MENLQITKKLKAFWRRSAYACVMGISFLSMNGCSKTTEEQITPQANSFVKEYNLKEVAKPTDGKKIVYLNDMAKANAFFQNLKTKRESGQTLGDKTANRLNGQLVLSHGFFTFLNGQTATINFDMQSNNIDEIESARINNEILTFTQYGNYVQMFKWGIVAIPNNKQGLSEEYGYYYAPVVAYSAVLTNGGWSSVQFLDAYEQANFDGEGTWETVYMEKPYFSGNDSPVTGDTWKPQIPSGN
jgi:hypothetical protein